MPSFTKQWVDLSDPNLNCLIYILGHSPIIVSHQTPNADLNTSKVKTTRRALEFDKTDAKGKCTAYIYIRMIISLFHDRVGFLRFSWNEGYIFTKILSVDSDFNL